MNYYVVTLGVYFFTTAIFALGLNLQYGFAGILNFAYILFFAAGAYVTGASASGSDHGLLAQSVNEVYLFGLNLHMPFPLDVVLGTVAGGLVAAVVGLTLRRSKRHEFAALVSVIVFLALYTVVGAFRPLFNGYNGLALVPTPFPGLTSYAYLGCCAGFFLVAALVCFGITRSPAGRLMRAVRDRPEVVEALGKNVFRVRLTAFIVGNALAALAGGLTVLFITGWSPASWQFAETLNILGAVIVGGAGNNWGALLGALLVGVGVGQAVLFLPTVSGDPNLIPSLEWVVIGLAIILFLRFRPSGLIPEKPVRFK